MTQSSNLEEITKRLTALERKIAELEELKKDYIAKNPSFGKKHCRLCHQANPSSAVRCRSCSTVL